MRLEEVTPSDRQVQGAEGDRDAPLPLHHRLDQVEEQCKRRNQRAILADMGSEGGRVTQLVASQPLSKPSRHASHTAWASLSNARYGIFRRSSPPPSAPTLARSTSANLPKRQPTASLSLDLSGRPTGCHSPMLSGQMRS